MFNVKKDLNINTYENYENWEKFKQLVLENHSSGQSTSVYNVLVTAYVAQSDMMHATFGIEGVHFGPGQLRGVIKKNH